jgi:hypothetical protein
MKFLDIKKNRNLSNLRNLQMPSNTPVRYAGVCKNIVELYPGIVAIKLSILESTDISGCLSALSNLQLRDLEIYIPARMAINTIICEFISKQYSLQSLSIHCPVLESETIIKLLSNLKVLTCLDLSSSTGVDGCVFTALPELSKLTALDLSDTTVNDDGLKNIVTKEFHLKNLTLMYCTELSDTGIGYIADRCHCIERLVIYSRDDIDDCGVRLFPSTLESLGKGCQKLKYLEVGNCTGLDDYGVIALVQNCHDLEYLQLHSKNISSSSLHEISHFCSNLFHLEIDGYNVNAASVESLLTEHRFIKYVSIRSCSNINAINLCKSKETELGILRTHSHASTLLIDGQTDIGYSAIEQIVTFCPDVCFLSLSPINKAVRGDVIEIAINKCPFLEMLTLDSEPINIIDFKSNLKKDQ